MMYNSPYQPVYPDYLDRDQPIYEQVRQRDVLLFYPYQSMQPFIDLLRQSAADPNVISIKITIYRLARNSAIAKALCDAAENGKEVTVLMELRARFDEQNNIEWARELEHSGCRILYGPDGYKCHAKVCLITRRERGGLSYVTQIGTGNYNEKTSTLYTDFCMMTANAAIARDAVAFFENMLIGYLYGDYEELLVAPNAMKNRLMRLIDEEIARGDRGRIIIKANSITERDLIDKLSEASCAGVKVDLVIRGICCLVPGVPGHTDNISVTSIVGRFLEHSRIYCFGEGELRRCYLSSADLMTRNQTRRVRGRLPRAQSGAQGRPLGIPRPPARRQHQGVAAGQRRQLRRAHPRRRPAAERAGALHGPSAGAGAHPAPAPLPRRPPAPRCALVRRGKEAAREASAEGRRETVCPRHSARRGKRREACPRGGRTPARRKVAGTRPLRSDGDRPPETSRVVVAGTRPRKVRGMSKRGGAFPSRQANMPRGAVIRVASVGAPVSSAPPVCPWARRFLCTASLSVDALVSPNCRSVRGRAGFSAPPVCLWTRRFLRTAGLSVDAPVSPHRRSVRGRAEFSTPPVWTF